MKTVSIIGAGRLGGSLAVALSRAGYAVDQLVYRSSEPHDILAHLEVRPRVVQFNELNSIDADIVFIAVADAGIRAVSDIIAPFLSRASIVFHGSGALSSEILSAAAGRGNPTGSIHPLISISDPIRGAGSFEGAFFCVEGNPAAVSAAEELVDAVGGKAFSVAARFKPLYHGSAVMASGHLVALIDASAEALSVCGIEPELAKTILLPLIKSTISNLSVQTARAALTGPFARADLEAVERHIDAFEDQGLENTMQIYLDLGLKALELAERNGAPARDLDLIRDAIKLAQQSAK